MPAFFAVDFARTLANDLASPVRTKFGQCLIAFTLICAIGGHWAVLQSVAWVGMVISYSQDSPLKEALVKTFDGQHPCKLCKVVREGKKSEQKQALLKVETKLDFLLVRSAVFLDAPMPFVVLSDEPDSAQPRAESPPTPPPRLA
ncbi:MAG: hypothetical protein L0Z50_35955 [Verrucomicrobiales bacterium]|nr:hypothetical protein [Verrucomicrobiales bacterium]